MSGRSPTAAVRLLSIEEEARNFLRLRATVAWETLRSMLTYARLRLSLVVLLSGLFWASLYGLFLEGFTFLEALHADVVSLLFNAFFSSLMVMLVFSSGILLYAGLYCSTEARLLLTLPARAETIFGHKFQEAMWFSGWGFVLLGSPMLVAYGVEREAGWPYFALLLPFMVAFVVIPAAIGCILCMLMVAWLPRLRMHLVSVAVAAVCLTAACTGWAMFASGKVDTASPAWFEQTFARLAVTEQKLFPSWWLSSGLIDAANAGRGSRDGMVAILEALVNAGSAAGRPLRLLLVKDLRLFRRDISQWSQFLIFFGLLGLYFLNLRSFNYNNSYASMIGFLNLAVVGLILSTFTTRFVYPMISLEGRRFWILGLLPVHRDQIVWSKFLFSFVGGVLPCCGLVFLSDWMLGIRPALILVHEYCCVLLCLGLSGIAVGLGARMPDLRESSPAKISSGFGGTLSLVISSLFIMLVVIIAALPTHLFLLTHALGQAAPAKGLLTWAGGTGGTVASLVIVGLLGLAASAIPLTLGLRAFRRLEP